VPAAGGGDGRRPRHEGRPAGRSQVSVPLTAHPTSLSVVLSVCLFVCLFLNTHVSCKFQKCARERKGGKEMCERERDGGEAAADRRFIGEGQASEAFALLPLKRTII
jgi:hypothetical protein